MLASVMASPHWYLPIWALLGPVKDTCPFSLCLFSGRRLSNGVAPRFTIVPLLVSGTRVSPFQVVVRQHLKN